MKKNILTVFACLVACYSFAGSILIEGFEYANHDETSPIGWTCDDDSWLCGFHEKDHNRIPHSGNWYAFTNTDESWMFMPLYLLQSMKYRFTAWAISDGSYQLEIWSGIAPNSASMEHQFMSAIVESEDYKKFSVYVEDIPANCQYIGIHALAGNGATRLTIDDIEVDMVEEYEFAVLPLSGDTVMYPGTEGSFDFYVQNLGYKNLTIYMHPSYEYFDNVVFHYNDHTGTSFPIAPDETVYVTATGTLKSEIESGSISWLDVNFTIPCDCATGLATFWVMPLGVVESFPLEGHFDQPNFMQQAWIVNEGMMPWEWVVDSLAPYPPFGNSEGMMRFRASETTSNSLLISPKMQLNSNDNLVRLHLYRTAENGDKDDCVNVYYNTEMSLRGAQLLGTLHQSVDRSPATEEEGWYEYNLNFDCADPVGFIIIEGVGDLGSDLYLDEVMIDNTPLAITEFDQYSKLVSVFPNPTTDFVNILGEHLQQVTVMDMTGKVIRSIQANGNALHIDLGTLDSGLYLISTDTANGKTVQTIVKK